MNIKELLALADRLDLEGKHKEAEEIDAMLQKLAIEMREDEDEEFKKKLMEEGWESPKVYIGTEEGSSTPITPVEPEKEEVGPSAELETKLSQLAEKGWDIFGPGDLEKWLEAKGYKKTAPKHEPFSHSTSIPPVPIPIPPSAEELAGEKKASRKNALTVEEVESFEIPGQEKRENPPQWTDKESWDRMSAINELNKLYKDFLDDPTMDKYMVVSEKLGEYVKHSTENAPSKYLWEKENDKAVLSQKKEVFEKLASIADKLDSIGATEEANLVDTFIQKHADDVIEYKGEDEKSEQSKRYDSKHHHSLQVREPKKEQERVDREGRKDHHVHTYQKTEAGALSTRYCPEHVGVMMGRVGESTFQCPLDGQTYNWETGWTDYDGNEHPGGSVAAQTPDSTGYAIPHRIFDSRENILNTVN